jgi:hypothetical protein
VESERGTCRVSVGLFSGEVEEGGRSGRDTIRRFGRDNLQPDPVVDVTTHLTTPASTRSASLHALTTLRETTLRTFAHSSGVGAEGREMKYADSTYAGTADVAPSGGVNEAR